ncbi:hypothetical protein [Campylobacter blaseri]|nr:hypothetical protein [Campylobacter blaseri]
MKKLLFIVAIALFLIILSGDPNSLLMENGVYHYMFMILCAIIGLILAM